MNNNVFLIFDTETTGINPNKCQLTQIAAIALHPRKLTVMPNGIFNSEIKPIFDDEQAIAAGYDPVEQKALEVTRKTREGLEKAPQLDIVWHKFVEFVKQFNPKNSNFTAPIPCGYNIINYDMPIIQRMCDKFKNVDKLGRQNIFHQIFKVDLMDTVFGWTEDMPDIKSRSLTAMAEYLGLPSANIEGAHDALQDVKNTANIFIKFMQFHRKIAEKTKFEKSFAGQKLFIE